MPPIRNLNEHPEPFVTPDELATHLKVSLDTIHRAIRSGALAAIRVGPRLLRIRTEDARRFLRPVESRVKAAGSVTKKAVRRRRR